MKEYKAQVVEQSVENCLDRGAWRNFAGIAKLEPGLNHSQPEGVSDTVSYRISIDTGIEIPGERFVASAWVTGWYCPPGRPQTCIVKSVTPRICKDRIAKVDMDIGLAGELNIYTVGFS